MDITLAERLRRLIHGGANTGEVIDPTKISAASKGVMDSLNADRFNQQRVTNETTGQAFNQDMALKNFDLNQDAANWSKIRAGQTDALEREKMDSAKKSAMWGGIGTLAGAVAPSLLKEQYSWNPTTESYDTSTIAGNALRAVGRGAESVYKSMGGGATGTQPVPVANQNFGNTSLDYSFPIPNKASGGQYWAGDKNAFQPNSWAGDGSDYYTQQTVYPELPQQPSYLDRQIDWNNI